MIHPDIVDEALGQIMMLIGALGIEADELACTAPEPDLSPRLRRLREISEDMVTLALAGQAVLRQSRDTASAPT